MIVDDNAEMRTLIRSLLSSVACEFIECASGEEGVTRFATERPDWTIMDVVMPGMDGLTATRQIKAQFPEARILVMTQHHNLKLRDSARAAGATRFLEKDQLVGLESILTERGNTTTGGFPP
ncbi:MAG: response regulator [Verrucomicrobia bacterium]|nr:response regulator [Verrucomicrobiota bacterium]